jgi:ribosomal protein L34
MNGGYIFSESTRAHAKSAGFLHRMKDKIGIFGRKVKE